MSEEILNPEAKIETVVSNREAVKQLKRRGVHTVGQLQQSAEARVQVPISAGGEVEESDKNIVLRSDKAPGLLIRMLPGIAQVNQATRAMQVTQPVVCEFHGGAATLSRKLWLTVKHDRDTQKINEELSKPISVAPWRNEAVRWLRQRQSYTRGDFQIVE